MVQEFNEFMPLYAHKQDVQRWLKEFSDPMVGIRRFYEAIRAYHNAYWEEASEVMEQAAALRLNVAELEERNKQMGTELDSLRRGHIHNSKLLQDRLLSQWRLRYQYARAMHLLFESKCRDGKEKMYTFDGCGPYKSVSDTPRELLSVGSWVLIWYEVEKRVKKRYEMFAESIKRMREKEKTSSDGR